MQCIVTHVEVVEFDSPFSLPLIQYFHPFFHKGLSLPSHVFFGPSLDAVASRMMDQTRLKQGSFTQLKWNLYRGI